MKSHEKPVINKAFTPEAYTAYTSKPHNPPSVNRVFRSLSRKKKVLERTGHGKTTLYELIKQGLFVPPVNIGGRSVAWPDDEVDAIIDARIAGKSDAEIKVLVSELLDRRKGESKNAMSGGLRNEPIL